MTATTKTSTAENTHYTLGIGLLVLVALIFSSTLPVIKGLLGSISPELLIAVRCTIAAVLLTPFVRNLNIRLLRDGTIIGLLFFVYQVTSTLGVETSSANRGAFIVALSVVFVNLFEILSGKRLSVWVILGALLAFIGIGVMSWDSTEPLVGSVWLLACALIDSAYILTLEKFLQEHQPLQLAAVGCWVPAVLGLVWAAPTLTNQLEAVTIHLGGLIYLGVVATAFFAYCEAEAQRRVPGNEVAILRSLEPVFGSILSFLLLGETFKTRGFIGAGLVLVAIVMVVGMRKVDDSRDGVQQQIQEATPLLEPIKATELKIPLPNITEVSSMDLSKVASEAEEN